MASFSSSLQQPAGQIRSMQDAGLQAAMSTALNVPGANNSNSNSNLAVNLSIKQERGAMAGPQGQWSRQENRDFIAIKAELEQQQDSSQRRRNGQSLWEIMSAKMRERGHDRSPEQCKLKLKNLHSRKKPLPPVDGQASIKKGKKHVLDRSSEDMSFEDDDVDADVIQPEYNDVAMKGKRPLKKAHVISNDKYRGTSIQEVLEDFLHQQQRIEMEWMEALNRREEERRSRESDFREAFENMERKRIAKEEAWREREEQWRNLEELKAQKRDAIFAALLARLE